MMNLTNEYVGRFFQEKIGRQIWEVIKQTGPRWYTLQNINTRELDYIMDWEIPQAYEEVINEDCIEEPIEFPLPIILN